MRRKALIAFLFLLLCGTALPTYYYFADRVDSSLVWGDKLRNRLRNCDEIVVTSGSPYDEMPDRRVLFRTRDKAVITNLIANFQIENRASGLHCGCFGNPTFEFFHGWHKLATVGMHHGKLLRWENRWEDFWKGDGMLTVESSRELVSQLKKHGLTDKDLE